MRLLLWAVFFCAYGFAFLSFYRWRLEGESQHSPIFLNLEQICALWRF